MERSSRRLAAVWFADIVGFTGLASRDEATALALIDAFQAIARREIEHYGGELVKFMGDGALAHFTSTAMAIEAALSVRESFDEIAEEEEPARLRFGIHVGDIVLSPTGDVYGDGVNVAARLQEEAPPGRIVVSEDVWRQCRQRTDLRFEQLGRRVLKGVPEPVWTYEVAHIDDGPAAAPYDGEERSVAVLPFDNLSGTDEAEILGAGLHNDLLTELSKVHGLTVISRTSVMGYRGTDKPMPQIGRELQVGTILEGAVQSAGRRVRLTVQLIDPRRDVHRWAESYDRELTAESLFAIQSELAERIVRSLEVQLTPPKRTAGEPPTTDLDAYRLHAEGRRHLDLRTRAGLERAIELFEEAIERDPDYVLAWVGLGDALTLYEDYGHGDAEIVLPRAERAIRRALELDPASAEAHASLGLLYSTYQDGPRAIRELKKAIELQPGYAEAHNWLSWLSTLVGNAEAALGAAKRAVELNPLSAEAVSNLTQSYIEVGENAKALVEARRAEELSPGWPSARFLAGVALYQKGEFAGASATLEGISAPWAECGPEATLALAYLETGEASKAHEVLARIEAEGCRFAAGLVELALGRTDEAFGLLLTEDRLGPWPALAVHHWYQRVWDSVREDPRYSELVSLVRRSWGLS